MRLRKYTRRICIERFLIDLFRAKAACILHCDWERSHCARTEPAENGDVQYSIRAALAGRYHLLSIIQTLLLADHSRKARCLPSGEGIPQVWKLPRCWRRIVACPLRSM